MSMEARAARLACYRQGFVPATLNARQPFFPSVAGETKADCVSTITRYQIRRKAVRRSAYGGGDGEVIVNQKVSVKAP